MKQGAMLIAGIDVGYSNLKVAYGEAGSAPTLVIRPAGAAPAANIGQQMLATGVEEPLHVLVGGKEYVAGVSYDRLENWPRELGKDLQRWEVRAGMLCRIESG